MSRYIDHPKLPLLIPTKPRNSRVKLLHLYLPARKQGNEIGRLAVSSVLKAASFDPLSLEIRTSSVLSRQKDFLTVGFCTLFLLCFNKYSMLRHLDVLWSFPLAILTSICNTPDVHLEVFPINPSCSRALSGRTEVICPFYVLSSRVLGFRNFPSTVVVAHVSGTFRTD